VCAEVSFLREKSLKFSWCFAGNADGFGLWVAAAAAVIKDEIYWADGCVNEMSE
jgi:hypothetical protein